MRTVAAFIAALSMWIGPLVAQETKPVPKDSVRVSIPGCTKGYVFTAGPRTADEPGSVDIPEGMHLRMNGPKKLMAEIKEHEGSMLEITGLMKRGQFNEGVSIGGVQDFATLGQPRRRSGAQSNHQSDPDRCRGVAPRRGSVPVAIAT